MLEQLRNLEEFKTEAALPRLWNRWQGLAIIGLFVVGYIALSIASVFLTMATTSFWLTVVTTVGSAIVAVGAVLIVNAFVTKHSWETLGFTPATRRWLVIGAVLAVVFGVLRGLVLTWLSETFPALNFGTELLEDLLVFDLWWEMVGITILTSTIVPFWEEFFFRGFIHNILRNKLGMWAAIIVSSLIFGLFHLIPLQVLGAFTLGIVIAWAYEKSGSLWVAIYIHALNNLVFTALAQLLQ